MCNTTPFKDNPSKHILTPSSKRNPFNINPHKPFKWNEISISFSFFHKPMTQSITNHKVFTHLSSFKFEHDPIPTNITDIKIIKSFIIKKHMNIRQSGVISNFDKTCMFPLLYNKIPIMEDIVSHQHKLYHSS